MFCVSRILLVQWQTVRKPHLSVKRYPTARALTPLGYARSVRTPSLTPTLNLFLNQTHP